jgi:glycosyltransferase involved in cell wall biosynthesis
VLQVVHERDLAGGLHLVVYTDAHAVGGAETATAYLVGALDRAIRVTVVGTDLGVVSRVAGSRPDTDAIVLRPIRGWWDISRIVTHRRMFARLQPDVFQASLPWWRACLWAVWIASTIPETCVIAVQHLLMLPESRRAIAALRFQARRVDAYVAVGERIARAFEERLHLTRGSVRVIHNGVPEMSYASDDAEPRVPTVGTIARLDPVKGIDVLLEAVAPLPGVNIEVLGRGPAEAQLRTLADRLGMTDRVQLSGWVDEPRRRLSSFSLFALPSWVEGLPLSICEAMLAGLPTVATDVGSVRELVRDGETGILVAPGDPVALRVAIKSLIEDDQLRRRMGRAGRQRALEGFTVVRMAQAYDALFREVTGRQTETK